MFVDCYVKVRLIPDMLHTKIARIIAKYSSDDDGDSCGHVAGLQGKNRQDEDKSADHAIHHREDSH